ncbi:MAG: pilin [Candidatus Absconditabacteria bacterium]
MKSFRKHLLTLLIIFSSGYILNIGVAAQNCTTLRGTEVVDGKSTTGYSIGVATYTTSCAAAKGTLVCNKGSFGALGNIYKYQSCTSKTWKNCTTPAAAKHLEYKTLYSSGVADYYNTCSMLGQSFQCIDGSFIGTNVGKYTASSCTDKTRRPCIDVRSNSYVNHLGTIFGYSAAKSTTTQSCSELKQTLTCTDAFWTPLQSLLFQSCQDSNTKSCSFAAKTADDKGLTITIPSNSSTGLFSSNFSVFPQTCTQLKGQVSCTNGKLSNETKYIYTSCSDGGSQSCSFTGADNVFITIPSNSSKTLYSAGYTSNSCTQLTGQVSCNNGKLSNNYIYKYSACTDPTSQSCSFTGADNVLITIPSNSSKTLYSAGSTTFPNSCTQLTGQVSCTNGKLSNNYVYKYSTCSDGSSKSCSFTGKDIDSNDTVITIPHGTGQWFYSTNLTTFPKTCGQLSGYVTCNNGVTNLNDYLYNFTKCRNGQAPSINPGTTIGVDLKLAVSFPGGGTGLAQKSTPSLNVFLINSGTENLSGSNIQPGFLSCFWKEQNLNIYQSKIIEQLTIKAGTTIKKTILLNNIFTQGLGEKHIYCTVRARGPVSNPTETMVARANNTSEDMLVSVQEAGRFDLALNRAVDPIKNNLDAPEIKSGVEGINDFLMTKVMNILVPIIIVIGILMAMFGFYKILFSSDDKAISDGVKLIGFGVVGIIIIMSAKFFSTTLYSSILMEGNLGYGAVQGYDIAQKIYEQLLFPFLKIGIYLSLGVLFVMLAARVVTFVFDTDEDTKKKAGTIITWNVIGMLVIIGSKAIVEFVYGAQDKVVHSVNNLGEIGSGILATKNFPLIYHIINWAMGLASLLILVMILFQAFQLLMKPDDPDAMKKSREAFCIFLLVFLLLELDILLPTS